MIAFTTGVQRERRESRLILKGPLWNVYMEILAENERVESR